MKVLLVEDHRLVADAMRMMLQDIDPDMEITSCYSTQHALSVVDAGPPYDLVLTDLFMPGIDGLGLLAGLRNRHSRTPVVVISGHDEDRFIRAAIEHGAAGFIPKTLPGTEVISGLRQIIAGGRFFPERFAVPDARAGDETARPSMPRTDAAGAPRPGRKQLQVLQLMADGNSNKQISQIVGITEATVKYHTSQLFRLFGVRNRTSCVREAQQRGLIRSFEEH